MSLSSKAEILSPLYQNRVFQSDERVVAHDHVSRELAEHALRWKGGIPDAAFFKRQLNQLTIYLLRYGAEVEVTPRPFDDFSLVHTSLIGGAEIECDGLKFTLPEGRSAVLSPRRRVQLRWYPGTQQLILKVPHALVQELFDVNMEAVANFAPGFVVDRGLNSQWSLIIQSLLNVISLQPDTALDKLWIDHLERNVAMFLLAHQPQAEQMLQTKHDVQSLKPVGAKEALLWSGDSRRMNAIMEYMDARLGAPLSLEDIANAANVSTRTINELCRKHHGVTPMELLRNMRLDAVRARLLAQPDLGVTETALTFGFGHLGRFSGYYFDRFGELPRQTQSK